MKYLITGSRGFIGSNLKAKLENDHSISTIDENIFQDLNWKITLLNHLDTYKPDAIFHIGACSNTLETNVQYIMVVNFEFTKVLTDWCSINHCPIIYSSSAANYGSDGNHPTNLYAWSKYTAEGYVNSNQGISLRYFNVYGFGEHNKGKMASVIYQALVHQIKTKDKFKLFPNKPLRDFVYIEDVIDANLYALDHYKDLFGKTYDVGFGVAEPFEKILDLVGIDYDYYGVSEIPQGYQFYTCSDKTKWMKGWNPKYNLSLGINDYRKKMHRYD